MIRRRTGRIHGAMAELLIRVADEAAARVLKKAKHRNLVWAIGTFAAAAMAVGSDVAANLIAAEFGESITAFVRSNWALLSDVAATYGQGVLLWFRQTVGPLVAGVDTTVVRPVGKPRRPK